MIRRSREEWFAHFESQALSGQSIQAYCKTQGLCNKHFSLRRKQLGWHLEEKIVRTETGVLHERFVPVQINPAQPSTPDSDRIRLQYSGLCLELPARVSAGWLVELLKGLS